MFGLKKLNVRLEEAEARIRGLIKMADLQGEANQALSETNKRLAGAIDELEARINNNHTIVNAAFGGLSRRVGSIAQDAMYTAYEEQKLVECGKCPRCVGGELDTGFECISCGFDAQQIASRGASLTSTEHMDALVVHGLHEAEALDRARADR